MNCLRALGPSRATPPPRSSAPCCATIRARWRRRLRCSRSSSAASPRIPTMNVPDVSGHARWIYASLYLRGLGRFEETATEMGPPVPQDPLNATWHAIWGAHLLDAGRFDQAIEEGLRATELEPNYFIAQHLLGEA